MPEQVSDHQETDANTKRTQWASRAAKLFAAGEEAGGNLAAFALVARSRLGPPLAGQILLSPMLEAGMATCSYRDALAGPRAPWAAKVRGALSDFFAAVMQGLAPASLTMRS